MDPEIVMAGKKIVKDLDIPVEVKKIGKSYYLYRDTARWDPE